MEGHACQVVGAQDGRLSETHLVEPGERLDRSVVAAGAAWFLAMR
jgi:hypothetical protein